MASWEAFVHEIVDNGTVWHTDLTANSEEEAVLKALGICFNTEDRHGVAFDYYTFTVRRKDPPSLPGRQYRAPGGCPLNPSVEGLLTPLEPILVDISAYRLSRVGASLMQSSGGGKRPSTVQVTRNDGVKPIVE